MKSSNVDKANSKEYKGNHISFTLGEKVGSGGNGEVYNVNIIKGTKWLKNNWSKIYTEPLVVKFFAAGNIKDKMLRKERYRRFCREIAIVNEIGNSISGVIPIIDFHYDKNCPRGNDGAWYIMPKAQPKYVKRVKDTNELVCVLKDMLQLAETIKEIHKRNIVHRDIKPKNILIYKNRISLCDFGLVYIDSEPLTQVGEQIGPLKILPPEMDGTWESIKGYDYKPSDLYLFVKVVWMYIKGDYYGFRGEYQRGDKQIYLAKEQWGIKTFEPIHEMLEGATKTCYKDRISIEDCINLLNRQLTVCDGTMDNKQLQECIYKESIMHFKSIEIPDIVLYNGTNTIKRFMKESASGYRFAVSDGNGFIEIDPLSIKNYPKNVFEISYSLFSKDIRNVVLSVNRIQIENNIVRIITKDFEWHMDEYVEVRFLNELFYKKEKKFLLRGTYQILVKARSA